MADSIKINSFKRVVPMIYAYNTPGVAYHDGWTKIGYTERDVRKRIAEQTHTAGINIQLAWQDNAMYKDGSGEYFDDHPFHAYLERRKSIERKPGTEWFKINGNTSRTYFDQFALREDKQKKAEGYSYDLRKEQEKAVKMTLKYLKAHDGKGEFLWNAKPRFGKTLTAYDLIRRMDAKKVLIVTNRPSIANSWNDDFQKFIAWQTNYLFISNSDSLKGHEGVMTRNEYLSWLDSHPATPDNIPGQIAFESLQGLKGSIYFGGEYDKLKWIADLDWDVLIVDEAHEGVDTEKTDHAFDNIKRKFTLYLSGTPFKALASSRFRDDQIFNWSYADEQQAKEEWKSENRNPYEELPKLNMFTYQLSSILRDKLEKGLDLSGDEGNVDYAFDLNEFFRTENGHFVHEDDIKKFLHALTVLEKYPFSTPELRKELSHTLWLLDRVDSAKALAKMLHNDPVFQNYEIVLAAGNGKLDEDEETDKAYDRVKQAIKEHPKTITLSVGQLTTGVTIPEWSGVLMLSNMKSPAQYMQAAFRAQNPCVFTENGQRYRKENAYVFDFDPARTLVIFDEFANNLKKDTAAGNGTSEKRQDNIKRLLNFFPVIGEDDEGQMVELDAKEILSIPRKLKCQEVVRRGFMSNFLFQNISNIFGAPGVVQDILEKLTPAHEEINKKGNGTLDGIKDVSVDKDGNAEVSNEIVIGKTQDLFGDKIYEDLGKSIQPAVNLIQPGSQVCTDIDRAADVMKKVLKVKIIAPAAESSDLKKAQTNRLESEMNKEVDHKIQTIKTDFQQQQNIAKAEHENSLKEAQSEKDAQKANASYQSAMKTAFSAMQEDIQMETNNIIQNKPQEVVKKIEQDKAEKQKNDTENGIRDRLRGFSRTIPSFIMAYGDGKLSLHNFDDYTEDDVFHDVTGITENEFRFLRDGGDYSDPDSGEKKHFDGHLFDEVVFNDSVNEFWNKKQQLANYFDETNDEDIFDYIPPQKTNQIFTPKAVVKKMVDELEENNPGIFGDPDKTFADLYMKSGLFITEIVKRLYQNENMKRLFPDTKTRIRHILQKQVYGLAPTRIIYLIATHYIFGFDEELMKEKNNFRQADAAQYAKNGTLEQLVEKEFGKDIS